MESETIVARLVAQDFGAVDELVAAYGDAIRRTIRSILHQQNERSYWEEIENEVLFTIWQKAASFDPEKASFATWVLMITRSKAIDQKRRVARDYQREAAVAAPEEASEATGLEKEAFIGLIDSLSEVDQQIFLLFYFYQLPPEIAQQVALSPEAVYNHLSRGRKKLKDVISKGDGKHGL